MIIEEKWMQAQLLDWTAALYLRVPDARLVTACLGARTMLGDLFQDEKIPALISQAGSIPLVELQEDYYALFLVPVSGRYLPPFESAHRDRQLAGTRARAVAAFYSKAGFELAQLKVHPYWCGIGMPDHIGFEMAFLSAVLDSAAQAEEMAAVPLLDMRDLFWEEHLGGWASDYGSRLCECAQTPLYQALGTLTARIGCMKQN